jgi:hypothetical protein
MDSDSDSDFDCNYQFDGNNHVTITTINGYDNEYTKSKTQELS